MNRTTFLTRLREGLSGMPEQEIDDVVADYAAQYSEG